MSLVTANNSSKIYATGELKVEALKDLNFEIEPASFVSFIGPSGIGPTEAFCKTLTARLKGSGMRWDSPNAEGIMALAAMDQSGQWQTYWNLQNVIAA